MRQAVVNAADLDAAHLEAALRRTGNCRHAMRVTGGLGAAETTSYAVSVRVNVEESGRCGAVAGQ